MSSHRLRPSAPWWMHRGDVSAGPAGRDSEARMPFIAGKQKKAPPWLSKVFGINCVFSLFFLVLPEMIRDEQIE